MAKLSRRELFKAVSAGTLLIPVSYVLGVSFGGYARRLGLKYLTDKEAAILESLAEAIIPNENAIGLSVADVNVVQRLDDLVGAMPTHSQSRVSLLIWTVEHIFPLRGFYFRKFSKLSVESRRKVLLKIDARGGVAGRALIRALKILVQNAYFGDPRVAQAIEYVGKCDK